MFLMTRTTHCNKIINIPSVFTIYISPLYFTRLRTFLTTQATLSWFTFLTTNPLMKSTITDTLSFPSVIFITRYFFGLPNSPVIRPLIAFFELRFFTSLLQLLVPVYRITPTRTVVSWLNFRRGTIVNCITSWTVCFNHGLYYRLNFGELQV